MEKIDASPANSFTVDERLLPRSFMYIRKNSGPKTESWGTPASIGDHEDTWTLKKTRWNLHFKTLLMRFQLIEFYKLILHAKPNQKL